ncbi:hypothetical protein MLD38_000735 [Melastoma candidum]|uniref:Uncharacterized protein n=1 Tax=Melastoma candidum TaxID=119954 RepID=A0ACB9SAZ7_9MYRT|nr:hypothetical protein MLD38_000735 [Melastoma candidum]
MIARIIFCIAVTLAVIAVVLLALLSPLPHRRSSRTQPTSWVAFSLYIQQPNALPSYNQPQGRSHTAGGVFTFHRTLTEGPESTSKIVGRAQGFIIPLQHFAHSGFNIIYLTFDTPDYSGSLSIEARELAEKDREELDVVGGTGDFAFARGKAIFTRTRGQFSDVDSYTYNVKLHLRFPNRSRTIPG